METEEETKYESAARTIAHVYSHPESDDEDTIRRAAEWYCEHRHGMAVAAVSVGAALLALRDGLADGLDSEYLSQLEQNVVAECRKLASWLASHAIFGKMNGR